MFQGVVVLEDFWFPCRGRFEAVRLRSQIVAQAVR